jgi:hypothetical protein
MKLPMATFIGLKRIFVCNETRAARLDKN